MTSQKRTKFVNTKQPELIDHKPPKWFIDDQWEPFIKRERLKVIAQQWPAHLNEKWQEFIENNGENSSGKRAVGPKLTAHLAENALIQQNQLYRVEIHHNDDERTTVKWSHDNGSVVYPITWINAKSDSGSGCDISVNGSVGNGLD